MPSSYDLHQMYDPASYCEGMLSLQYKVVRSHWCNCSWQWHPHPMLCTTWVISIIEFQFLYYFYEIVPFRVFYYTSSLMIASSDQALNFHSAKRHTWSKSLWSVQPRTTHATVIMWQSRHSPPSVMFSYLSCLSEIVAFLCGHCSYIYLNTTVQWRL